LVFTGFAGDDIYAVRDDEGAVETDAELADEVRVALGVAAEIGEEVLGSGAGDGAEVGDQILFIHADAVVGDGEDSLLFVERQFDLGIEG
jgi:hypothetical protein